jgi:hypothetical protein
MTLAECIEQVHKLNLGAVCYGDAPSLLNDTQSIFVILSSIALIIAAFYAGRQVSVLKRQLSDSSHGVFAQISSAAQNHRLASTLQLLIHQQTNDHWVTTRKAFVALRDKKEGLKQYVGENSEGAVTVRQMLNTYELIAIGIRAGILDEKMYETFYRGTFVRDWNAAREFITEERDVAPRNPRYWIEMERLAQEFEKRKIADEGAAH